MKQIGRPENVALFKEVADRAITLVKDKQDIWPVTPEKYKRVLLVNVKTAEGAFTKLISGNKPKPIDLLKAELESKGFEVEIHESPMDKISELPPEEQMKSIANAYAAKRPIKELTDKYDLIINVANVKPGEVVQRMTWNALKGTPDIPFYVHEIPTIFVSVNYPFHLADVPQVKTYINAYDGNKGTLELLVEKMMGQSEFKGVDPVDSYCGLMDTRI